MNIIHLLIDNGADPNQCCDELSPLFYAALCPEREELFNILIKAGADINKEIRDNGSTILHTLIEHYSRGALKLGKDDFSALLCQLIEKGAKSDYMNHEGKYPMDYAKDPDIKEIVNFGMD